MADAVLATCLEWPALSESDLLYAAALAERGVTVTSAPWNGPSEPFQGASVVVLRSTWDYHHASDAFAGWLRALERGGTRICNAPRLLAWNMDKGYLLELQRRDVSIPATAVVANAAAAITAAFDRLRLDQAVVKPAIGASGHNVRLVRRQEIESAAAELLGVTPRLLVQEFVPEVQQTGELSCIFFDGRFSHAVVKQPAAGEYRVNSQYGGRITATAPTTAIVRQAQAVLALLPEQPLYARIDGVVREGTFLLMELELIEPALYLQYAPEAAAQFADATVRRLKRG